MVNSATAAAGEQLPGVFIKTFGCQMNEHDSEKLLKILESRYRRVTAPEQAQLIIINTCSVREKPVHKVFSLLGDIRRLKVEDPEILIGVGGCVAQQEGIRIIERAPFVDFVFGTHNLSLVPSLIDLRKSGSAPQVAVDYRDEWEVLPFGTATQGRVSVYISISRGCNKKCSFCIVPVTRGREVSRPLDEIEREARIAVQGGAKEVVLLGQTVNSYGRDLLPRSSFAELLERLTAVAGIERLRFTSPHPAEVRDDFIALLGSSPKIASHIHMPLQSGSNSILKAMRRSYTKERYLEIIAALRGADPQLSVTTDIIVGFPGELEVDFEETLDVLTKVAFENSYSFVFSARPGTLAASLADPVPYEVKLSRLKVLQERQQQVTAARLAAWVGRKTEVLVEGESSQHPGRLCGRNSQNIMVNLDAEYGHLKAGMLVVVDVLEAGKHTLRGQLSSI